MSDIVRTKPGPVLSAATESGGFVFLQGVVPKDVTKDIGGQTAEVLAEIDSLLAVRGTDKSRLLQAQIWLKDNRDKEAMNGLWTKWLPEGCAPARACVQAHLGHPRCLVEIMIIARK